jgi:peptidoglycan hydrolase CwlO-like protein
MLTGTFTVPTLALGAYTIKANETSGNWNATAAFTIGEATLTINTRALTYFQGNTISFNIQSSFAGDLQINVYDPTGIPTALVFPYYAFVPMGSLYVIPYAYPGLAITAYTFGLALPSDATTGTWFWNTTFIGLTRNGTFTVVASAAASTVTNTDLNSTLTQILRDLANMNTTLLSTINASVISINGNVATISTSIGTLTTTVNAIGANVTSIKGTVATIQTSIGTLQTTVTAINASLVGINNGFATVQTSVGTLTTSVSSISSTLSGVSGTVGTISSSVGSLTTSLSSIGTTVTSINGNVATIKTDLGTLSGTVTTISNGVATIQTGIGTLQADVSSLTTDVSNVPGQISIPIWVAVVLALIAALAAIASLLLVRRKIAG